MALPSASVSLQTQPPCSISIQQSQVAAGETQLAPLAQLVADLGQLKASVNSHLTRHIEVYEAGIAEQEADDDDDGDSDEDDDLQDDSNRGDRGDKASTSGQDEISPSAPKKPRTH